MVASGTRVKKFNVASGERYGRPWRRSAAPGKRTYSHSSELADWRAGASASSRRLRNALLSLSRRLPVPGRPHQGQTDASAASTASPKHRAYFHLMTPRLSKVSLLDTVHIAYPTRCVLRSLRSWAVKTAEQLKRWTVHSFITGSCSFANNKKLIRRWDSERELSLRRHRARTTKYNRLVHKFRHR